MSTIGMLHNTETNRFHPILFHESPRPSGGPMRSKSSGHHTVGFDTREEALKYIDTDLGTRHPGFHRCLERDFPWDGTTKDAVYVLHFSEPDAQNNVVPMF